MIGNPVGTMHKKLLITFGCSWAAGTGVGYQPGIIDDEYNTISSDMYIKILYNTRKGK